MREFLIATGLIILAVTGADDASAQAQPTNQVPAPSAETLADASAEADRLIASTGAVEFFENVSSGGMARVRHKASGLLCSFTPDLDRNTLALFGSPGVPRGDDVGCQADVGEVYMTFYATRYPGGMSAQDAADGADEAIRQRYPEARPYDGPIANAALEGASDQAAVRYSVMDGPVPSSAHAITIKIGEWVFKQRLTHSDESGMAAQVIAQASWSDVIRAALQGPAQ